VESDKNQHSAERKENKKNVPGRVKGGRTPAARKKVANTDHKRRLHIPEDITSTRGQSQTKGGSLVAGWKGDRGVRKKKGTMQGQKNLSFLIVRLSVSGEYWKGEGRARQRGSDHSSNSELWGGGRMRRSFSLTLGLCALGRRCEVAGERCGQVKIKIDHMPERPHRTPGRYGFIRIEEAWTYSKSTGLFP